MAMWTEGKKALFVGTSGLQFQQEVLTDRPLGDLRRFISEFYQARGVVPAEPSKAAALSFTRGSKTIGRLSWLLFLSEKWAFHQIDVSFSEHEGITKAVITYNAWMYFTLIVKPNLFEREVLELRVALRGNA